MAIVSLSTRKRDPVVRPAENRRAGRTESGRRNDRNSDNGLDTQTYSSKGFCHSIEPDAEVKCRIDGQQLSGEASLQARPGLIGEPSLRFLLDTLEMRQGGQTTLT